MNGCGEVEGENGCGGDEGENDCGGGEGENGIGGGEGEYGCGGEAVTGVIFNGGESITVGEDSFLGSVAVVRRRQRPASAVMRCECCSDG